MSMEDFVKTLNDDQKQALLKALNEKSITTQSVPDNVNEQTKRAINNSFITESKPLNKQKRREPVKAKTNQWQDTGEHRNVETPEITITPRNRSGPKHLSVNCHVCGKSFKIDQRFVCGEFHRCDRCVGR